MWVPGWPDSQPPTSPPPWTRLTTPLGRPFVVQDLDQASGGARGEIAGLDHGCAAYCQGERQFLGNDQEREVPRCDHPNNADGFLDRYRQVVRAQVVVGVTVGVLGETRGVIPNPRCAGHLIPSLRDRLAGFQRLDQGQLVALGFNSCGNAPQQSGPLGTGDLGPVT